MSDKTLKISRQWLDFAEIFKRQSLPDDVGGELLTLAGDDLALTKVIYGLFASSSLEWLKERKSKYLEFKTPLQCIQEKRFDLLYPYLMASMASDKEKDELRAALLQGKISLDDPCLSERKRVLITQIIDGFMRETQESKPC